MDGLRSDFDGNSRAVYSFLLSPLIELGFDSAKAGIGFGFKYPSVAKIFVKISPFVMIAMMATSIYFPLKRVWPS